MYSNIRKFLSQLADKCLYQHLHIAIFVVESLGLPYHKALYRLFGCIFFQKRQQFISSYRTKPRSYHLQRVGNCYSRTLAAVING